LPIYIGLFEVSANLGKFRLTIRANIKMKLLKLCLIGSWQFVDKPLGLLMFLPSIIRRNIKYRFSPTILININWLFPDQKIAIWFEPSKWKRGKGGANGAHKNALC
jgi:hypothetical protein